MTPPKKNEDGRKAPEPEAPANRGRKPSTTDKNLTRTGELSLEQVKKWLATRRAESRAKRESDKGRGASA
jgi:hypothetical protein